MESIKKTLETNGKGSEYDTLVAPVKVHFTKTEC